MAETEVARILDELNREHSGDAWHGTPLMQILAGIDYRQAAARPLEGVHTIWQIVLHITAWKNEVRRRLGGAPAGEPPEGDWPEPAAAGPQTWAEAVAALESAHRALIATVEPMPEAILFVPTNDPREGESGQGVTHYVLLHGTVQHDVYHAAQIALLKKAGAATSSA